MTRIIDRAKADYGEQDWKDVGCEFEDHCLECERPEDQCPAHYSRVFLDEKKLQQRAEIKMRLGEGQTKEFICEQMNISESTFQRRLK